MRLIFLTLCALLFARTAEPSATIVKGAEAGTYVLTGTFVTPGTTIKGKLVVKGDTIACIGADCVVPPGATRIAIQNAYVFPGFIDAHQHMSFNFMPRWKNTRVYPNRYEWQKDPDHLAFTAPHKKMYTEGGAACEMLKYAEIRALVSGVTTVQGSGDDRSCLDTLVRNADNRHGLPLPAKRVVAYVPDVRKFEIPIDWSVTKCLAIHLGEGIDEYTRDELSVLDEKGLLRPETMIIHATAFGPAEFARIARAGAKVVWSPESNLALYGRSMNVRQAIEAGVPVSLGVDWSPSGSSNILEELKVADRVNRKQMRRIVRDDEWLSMITSRPAQALSLDSYIGSLEAGKKADLVILKRRSRNFNKSLLKNQLADVEMVWIGGRLLYGDEPAVLQIRGDTCEKTTVGSIAKRICVADPLNPADRASETFADIENRIRTLYPQYAPINR